MPATPLEAGMIIELGIYCRMGPQLGINVVHHEINSVTGGITDVQLVNWWNASAFGTGLVAKYPPVLTFSAAYKGLALTIIYPTRQITKYVVSPAGGSGGNMPLPMQSTGLIRKMGSVPGRHGRGRVYLPFPDQAMSEIDGAGYPSPTGVYQTNAGFIAAALCTAVVGAAIDAGTVDLSPVIYNRALPAASVIIADYQVPGKWCTQRRRSESGRPNATPFD